MRRLRNQKGFTLLELMVVVIIVMVLAGIAVPVYMHYVREGKKSEAYAVMDAAIAGAKVYYQRHETYDFADDDWVAVLAEDDVDNAVYFTYSITADAGGNGFEMTATELGTWAPDGAYIEYSHKGATDGNAGHAEYDPPFMEVDW